MKVKDVMTKEVRWVEVPGTRADALDLMKELGVEAVPAVRKGSEEYLGMVELRTLFEKPDEDQLAMLVNRGVPALSPEDGVSKAARVFLDRRERRLPVVNRERRVVGVLAVRDLLERVLLKSGIEAPVSELMRPHIIAVWDETPLQVVAHLIRLSGFREVPVIDRNGRLVGVVSDSDLVRLSDVEVDSKVSQMVGRSESDSWAWDTEARVYITRKVLRLPDKSVREIMRRDVATVGKRASAVKVAQLMLEQRVRQVLVQDADERLLGIVRDVDLLKALAK